MFPQDFGAIILGMACLCVIITTESKDTSSLKPTGPKMCERLCNHTIGCATYIYFTSDLSCRLTTSLRKGDYMYNSNAKDKNRKLFEMKCQKNAVIFRTKQNEVLCRRRWCRQKREEKMTRILMLAKFNKKGVQGRILHLKNNSVVSYPYIRDEKVEAVAYISAFQKLIVATDGKPGLFFAPLDKSSKTIIKRTEVFNDISVDNVKQLVFLAVRAPQKGVSVMTTVAENFKSLLHIKSQVGIATDNRRSILYITSLFSKLLQYTYQGVLQRVVVKGYMAIILFVDMERGSLYYAMGVTQLTIFEMTMSDLTSSQVKRLVFKISNFYVIRNILFVFPFNFEGELITFAGNGKTNKMATGYKNEVLALSVCQIP